MFQEFESNCFYCGRKVSRGNVEVDHFIPGSFIKDDQLWNFVLACPACNNQKRDKLADRMFLDRLEKRNQLTIETRNTSSEFMKTYRYNRLVKIYDWAKRNGYDQIWTPRRKENVCIKF